MIRLRKPTFTLYVFPDASHQHELFVNGERVEVDDLHTPRESYATPYPIFSDRQHASFEIKSAGAVDYQAELESGAYLVNLSTEHLVGFRELKYLLGDPNNGSPVPFFPKQLYSGELGCYLIDKNTNVKAFNFGGDVPLVIREQGHDFSTVYVMLSADEKK